MRTQIAKLKYAHWDTLSAAEQRSIRRGAWILLPLLAYGLLWQPAHDALPKLKATLPQLRAQASQMSMQAGEVQNLRQRAQLAVLDGNALRSAIDNSAKESGLSFVVTPAEQNSVHISSESLSFELWLQWLRTLERSQHIRVETAMLSAAPVPGNIKVQATLSNGADL
ncbi:MAG: type II secretion system protein GspM [Sideroxydans sp.]|nr:type II secretion system protein GspM [Sideroxydans sp.]